MGLGLPGLRFRFAALDLRVSKWGLHVSEGVGWTTSFGSWNVLGGFKAEDLGFTVRVLGAFFFKIAV